MAGATPGAPESRQTSNHADTPKHFRCSNTARHSFAACLLSCDNHSLSALFADSLIMSSDVSYLGLLALTEEALGIVAM